MVVNHLPCNFNTKNYSKVHQSHVIFLISHNCPASMSLLAFCLWGSTSWVLSGVCAFGWDSGTNFIASFHLRLQLNLCSAGFYTVFSASKLRLQGISPMPLPAASHRKLLEGKWFLCFYLHSSQARIRFLG